MRVWRKSLNIPKIPPSTINPPTTLQQQANWASHLAKTPWVPSVKNDYSKFLLFWLFYRVNSKPTNQRSSFCLCFGCNWEFGGIFLILIFFSGGLGSYTPSKMKDANSFQLGVSRTVPHSTSTKSTHSSTASEKTTIASNGKENPKEEVLRPIEDAISWSGSSSSSDMLFWFIQRNTQLLPKNHWILRLSVRRY